MLQENEGGKPYESVELSYLHNSEITFKFTLDFL